MVVKCISVVTVIVSLGTEHFGRVLRETQLFFMNMKVRGLRNHCSANALLFVKLKWGAMDFRLRRQSLLERAKHQEEKASREKNAQVQDLMRALAALYREMADELEDSGLFERRFLLLDFADLAGGDQSISAGQSHWHGGA